MSTKDIVIVGPPGGVTVEMLERLDYINQQSKQTVYRAVAILDPQGDRIGQEIGGIKVTGAPEDSSRYPDAYYIMAWGNLTNWYERPKAVERTGVAPDRWATIIHPTALVSPTAKIGHGNFIFEFATIGSSVETGNWCQLGNHISIGHHNQIGDYTLIMSHVVTSPRTTIGKQCFLAMNATVVNTTVGDIVMVGMGAVVTKPVPNDSVMVGNPARRVRAATASR